jgi:putative membrane protein
MIPNPEIWNGSPLLVAMFPLSLQWGGNLQIIAGAATLLAFGVYALGVRATLIFFVVSALVSLSLELTGTFFGWPFGAYEYTGLFGYKILDKVPPAIPLSWFYMGLASFLLAKVIVKRWSGQEHLSLSVFIGSLLLTAWDVVLDPAMSHPSLSLQYWYWEQTGPYMGMPLVNFLGWIVTGALFMSLASLLDKRVAFAEVDDIKLPFVLYASNMVFAIGICVGTGLWLPAVLGAVLLAAPVFALVLPVRLSPAVRRKV